jgi:hypothetical protein
MCQRTLPRPAWCAARSAVHSSIGWWFEERLAGRTPTLAQVDDIVVADLLAETAQTEVRWKDETPESLQSRGQALVRTYLTKYGEMDVVSVEQRFEVDITDPDTGEVLSRALVGYFDLVIQEGDSIVEVKTTSRAWHPLSLERHLQVGAYVTAANALHGGPSRVLAGRELGLPRQDASERFGHLRAGRVQPLPCRHATLR